MRRLLAMNLVNDRTLDLAWTQAWQLAALTIVVALVVKLGCRRRPQLAYLLWMLVIVKSLTPPLWSSPAGMFSWALVEINSPQTVAAEERRPVVSSARDANVDATSDRSSDLAAAPALSF